MVINRFREDHTKQGELTIGMCEVKQGASDEKIVKIHFAELGGRELSWSGQK